MRLFTWLDRWHWVILALAAPLLLFPSPSRSFAMLVVPGLWLGGMLARRRPLRRTPLNLALLILALMVLVSLYATYDIAQSLSKIAGMVLAFGVYFVMARKARRFIGWWASALVFAATSLGIAVFALVSVQWGAKLPIIGSLVARLTPRIVGLPGAESGVSANELAGALVWSIPLFVALTLALCTRRAAVREMLGNFRTWFALLALGGATLFTLAILVLTQSRGGYLGLAVGLAAMGFVVASSRWRAVMLAGGIVILIAGIIWLRADVTATPDETASALSAESVVSTWDGRTEVWSRAIYGIQDFPFTGMGMNTFRRVVHVLYPLFLVGPDFDLAHAHNEFLQAALDLGVPGLIAFLALYLGAGAMLWMIWSHAGATLPDARVLRAVVLGLGAGLLAHAVYGMTDAVTLGSKPGVLFWMMLGLIAGLYQQMTRDRLGRWYDWFGNARAVPPSSPESLR
ncbi:MAG: O-antigen ligase family protein [Chloroflexi bacterium]|nr:O-antigen ligase family protein [Chloroflexota bacterium]